MTSGISILHFEDQYMDITPMVNELYLILRGEANVSKNMASLTKSIREISSDVRVYDFTDPQNGSVPPTRYILTSREEFDDELKKLLFGRTIFVLDAWREAGPSDRLTSNVQKTFKSIEGHFRNIEDVVIYTAYPGNRKKIDAHEKPVEFTKAGQEELETYLLDNIFGQWRNE